MLNVWMAGSLLWESSAGVMFSFVLFFENSLEEFGILKFDFIYDSLNFGEDKLVHLFQLRKSIRDVVFGKFFRKFLKLQRNQLYSLVLNVLNKV